MERTAWLGQGSNGSSAPSALSSSPALSGLEWLESLEGGFTPSLSERRLFAMLKGAGLSLRLHLLPSSGSVPSRCSSCCSGTKLGSMSVAVVATTASVAAATALPCCSAGGSGRPSIG
eukprot:4048093-Alexandrium_andersonii.AAC.1